MKTRMTTHVDAMGRIVIPKEIRKKHGWEVNDVLSIQENDEGGVTVSSVSQRCCVCGSQENLRAIKNKFICSDCIAEL